MSNTVRIIFTAVFICSILFAIILAEEFGEKRIMAALNPFRLPKRHLGYSSVDKFFDRLQFTYEWIKSNDVAAIHKHPIVAIPTKKKQVVLDCSALTKNTDPANLLWSISIQVPINVESMAFAYHAEIGIKSGDICGYWDMAAIPVPTEYDRKSGSEKCLSIHTSINFDLIKKHAEIQHQTRVHENEDEDDNEFPTYRLRLDEQGHITHEDIKFPRSDNVPGVKAMQFHDEWHLRSIRLPKDNKNEKNNEFFQNMKRILDQKENIFCFLTGLAGHPLFTKDLKKSPLIRVLVDSGEIKEISVLVLQNDNSTHKSYCKGYHMWFSDNRLDCLMIGNFANVIDEPFGKLSKMVSNKQFAIVKFHSNGYPSSYKTLVRNRLFGRQMEWNEKGDVLSDVDLDIPTELPEIRKALDEEKAKK